MFMSYKYERILIGVIILWLKFIQKQKRCLLLMASVHLKKIGSVNAINSFWKQVTFNSRAVKANFRGLENLFACLPGADSLDLLLVCLWFVYHKKIIG